VAEAEDTTPDPAQASEPTDGHDAAAGSDPAAPEPATSAPEPPGADDLPPGDDEDEEEDLITMPGQRAVTAFDLGGERHEVSRPGDQDLPSIDSASNIPAIGAPGEPESDISTSPNQRAVTAFDLGASDHALKLPITSPDPWTPTSESIPIRLEKAGIVTTGDHALPEEPVDQEEDEAPELVKPVWAPADPVEQDQRAISRRRFIARGAAAAVAAGVGLHVWGRRPMSGSELGYRPSVFEDADFRTLFQAFEALLGDQEAAARAASQADLHFARHGAGPRDAIVADLRLLELGPRGLLQNRRFSRLSPEQARAVLEAWRTSRIDARRRIHGDLTRLARHCWATHPATLGDRG